MANERTDAILARLARGIDLANSAKPAEFKGINFVLVVAEMSSGEVSWACSSSDPGLGGELMLRCLEIETAQLEAAEELAAGATVQ